jgi:trans-aconitate methyltransferase
METAQVNHDALREFYNTKHAGGYMSNARYARWSHSGPQLLRIRETLRYVPRGPSAVLDYGCGGGAWTSVLSTYFPQAQVYGIDIAEVAIETARSNFPRQTFCAFDGVKAPSRVTSSIWSSPTMSSSTS